MKRHILLLLLFFFVFDLSDGMIGKPHYLVAKDSCNNFAAPLKSSSDFERCLNVGDDFLSGKLRRDLIVQVKLSGSNLLGIGLQPHQPLIQYWVEAILTVVDACPLSRKAGGLPF